jgi:hypothetical protein
VNNWVCTEIDILKEEEQEEEEETVSTISSPNTHQAVFWFFNKFCPFLEQQNFGKCLDLFFALPLKRKFPKYLGYICVCFVCDLCVFSVVVVGFFFCTLLSLLCHEDNRYLPNKELKEQSWW